MRAAVHACSGTCVQLYMRAAVHACSGTCEQRDMRAAVHARSGTCVQRYMRAAVHACSGEELVMVTKPQPQSPMVQGCGATSLRTDARNALVTQNVVSGPLPYGSGAPAGCEGIGNAGDEKLVMVTKPLPQGPKVQGCGATSLRKYHATFMIAAENSIYVCSVVSRRYIRAAVHACSGTSVQRYMRTPVKN